MQTSGQLYVVATPIGNLADMSPRAIEVLRSVDLILAEDTRHSVPLLRHFQINTACKSFHEHNENQLAEAMCQKILAGESIALISDAGTPLISDPGFPLIHQAHSLGIKVHSIPGPCAAIAAIAASGLAVDRFSFEGFLPHKTEARLKVLKALAQEARTLIFYESPHRVIATVNDMRQVFGDQRKIVLARELTKMFETIIHTNLEGLQQILLSDENQSKGEIVLIVEGNPMSPEDSEQIALEITHTLEILLKKLPLKEAVTVAVELTGLKKNFVYKRALEIQQGPE